MIEDFNALIQFLITRICALEGVGVSTTGATSSCPDDPKRWDTAIQAKEKNEG